MKRLKGLPSTAFFLLLLAAAVLTLLPFAWVVMSSFKNNADIFGSSFSLPSIWQWTNYTDAWFQGRFYRYIVNSIIVSVPTVIVVVVVTSAAGYAFAKLEFPGREIIFYGFLFGLTVPAFALLINLYYTLNSLGLVDRRFGLILAETALGIPLGVFIMRQFFADLPNAFVDAARIDGANEFQTFALIMLPMARPAVSALAVFTYMSSWNSFTLPLLILPTDAKRTIPVGLLYFQDQFGAQYGLMFAAIVMSLIPIVLIYVLFQRQFIQGLAAGSLK